MRTLAIGLDGCSWNVLDPLLETGELPNLARLRAEGAHGVLESTVPFYTGAAWASFATACSPAAHGIYDFLMLREGDVLSIATDGDLRRATYYEALARQGRRSVLVNLPLDQDGHEGAVIVNSWLTSDDERRMFPVDRREAYREPLAAYINYPTTFEAGLEQHLQDLREIERSRFALARELMLRERWDHFFVLFSSTDWLGHAATGRFLEGDARARDAFLRLYRDLDGYIGRLIEDAGDATVAVISDHGQCAETHSVRINTVFRELGLLRLRRERAAGHGDPGGSEGTRASVRVPTTLAGLRRIPWLRRFVRGANRWLRGRLGIEVVTPLRGLDVDRTQSRVFSPTVASYAVYARDCSAAELRAVADALLEVRLDDGRPAFEDVWTPEELYGRPLPTDGPSLVFAPSLGVRPSITVREPVVENVAARGRGAHQRDGIILIGGSETVARDLGRISIYDVAPTLLWAMGAAAPAEGDGRVVFEAFREAFAASHELREIEIAPEPGRRPAGGEHDTRAVEERLKSLGYI
jgi:predicted AlkP superfamily phosphohydrolase/phosphomutase